MESIHPSVVAGVLLIAIVYLYASRRSRNPLSPGQVAAFAGAMVTILFALDGPVDALEDARSFSAHMLQHLMLTLVMPPLLLLGIPGWMLRPFIKPRPLARIARLLTNPLIAFCTYNAVLVAIHLPVIYERMCRDDDVHIAVHLVLMAAGVLMWWPLLSPLPELPRLSYPAQLLYLFALLIPMAAVAAPITLASGVIYPWYLEGPHPYQLAPLADQVLGGLLMWVGAGFYFIGVFTVIFFRWARFEDRDQPPVNQRLRGLHVVPNRVSLRRI
ncbi:MAG TPA: cytochrome c oxidase assembly protein [Candidatus Binataceae bacterium]|nr:cytochrome c oxidase assembly protein [Candidatus Binataceae bacterium]